MLQCSRTDVGRSWNVNASMRAGSTVSVFFDNGMRAPSLSSGCSSSKIRAGQTAEFAHLSPDSDSRPAYCLRIGFQLRLSCLPAIPSFIRHPAFFYLRPPLSRLSSSSSLPLWSVSQISMLTRFFFVSIFGSSPNLRFSLFPSSFLPKIFLSLRLPFFVSRYSIPNLSLMLRQIWI